jgi:DNA invertase Pin-like site-specific DNA recombinase
MIQNRAVNHVVSTFKTVRVVDADAEPVTRLPPKCSAHGAPASRDIPARAVGYVRVSTEEQAREGVSLDAQDAKIRAYATAKDLALVDVIRDEGLSGKDLERPGVQRLIAACVAGEVAAVIVVKLDRLSRRTRDLLYLVEDVFQARDVALHSLHETVDTSSASGRFFLRIMGALAEMERELIGERTAAALAHKKALGQRLGTTPLGYRTPGHRLPLEAVAEEQAIIRRVLDLWRGGRSYRKVAATLNAEGAKTKHGARWHHSTVANVVRDAHARSRARRAS